MLALRSRPDFTYGNTRLRARRAAFLPRSTIEGLLGRDLDGVLTGLAGTTFRPDLEAALARHHGVRAVHAAVRSRSTRLLSEMRSFYGGPARELVTLLLERTDTQTVLTLLRGLAAEADAEEIALLTVPAGQIDAVAVSEVARQADIVAGARLLAAWRLPDAGTARALRGAIHDFELHADMPALEHAVAQARATSMGAALQRYGAEADPLRELHAAEGELADRLLALRDEPVGSGVDPVELQTQAEEAMLRDGMARFGRGDPLGLDIPVAYVTSVEAEARNVRLIAAAAGARIPAEIVRSRLVLA
jgi:V/A-type H+-transporting ATPase subunit C